MNLVLVVARDPFDSASVRVPGAGLGQSNAGNALHRTTVLDGIDGLFDDKQTESALAVAAEIRPDRRGRRERFARINQFDSDRRIFVGNAAADRCIGA